MLVARMHKGPAAILTEAAALGWPVALAVAVPVPECEPEGTAVGEGVANAVAAYSAVDWYVWQAEVAAAGC